MKQLLVSALAGAGLAWAAVAHAADEGEELMKRNGCVNCHAIDKKVAPSFKEVAAKYKGDKQAEAKLTEKVKKGGSGVWGQVPMPPNAQVKDEDIKTIVRWVLTQ